MMRNFEERKKEVLHRSARRIQRRRKLQKRLMGSGLSALCLALCLGVGLEQGLFLSRNQDTAAYDVAYDDAAVMNEVAVDMSAMDADDAMPAADKGLENTEENAQKSTLDPDGSGGCASDDADGYDVPTEVQVHRVGEVGNHGSDYEGVYLELSHVDLEGGSIHAFWINYTEQTVSFGPAYDIQRYEAGRWVSCAIDPPLVWTEERYELEPNPSDFHRTCDLERFDLSQPGLYRITSICQVGSDDTPYTLWAEFELI